MKIKLQLLFSWVLLMPYIAFSTESLGLLKKQAPWVGTTLDGISCENIGVRQGFGPYDYNQRGNLKKELFLVETAHFTPPVENLIHGSSATTPEQDLDYTLRAWPNHHRALVSIINYQLNILSKISHGKLIVPPECYLIRAINYSPKDAVVHSLYGHYLKKLGQLEESAKYYEKALALAPENAKISYSFSLLLIDLKRYDEAVKYAKIAYQNKHTPKGLKNKLIKLGVWDES